MEENIKGIALVVEQEGPFEWKAYGVYVLFLVKVNNPVKLLQGYFLLELA